MSMYKKLTAAQKKYVDRFYRSLTLDEKIGQLVNERGTYILAKPDPVGFLKKYPVGSIFTGSEVIETRIAGGKKTSVLQETVSDASLKTPVLYSGDFENGIGGGIKGYTAMPRTMGVSATFSEKDYFDYGSVISSEARALNIRWCFGPVSDINFNRENPVINIRSAGDNVEHVSQVVTHIVKGMQSNGCASCPKHFPGDGTDTRNQHYVTSFNTCSKEEWDRTYGKVFKDVIDAGAMSIMVGHLAFPAYEKANPETGLFTPATCSKKIMTDLLRKELGFEGIIITDALCMFGYLAHGDYEKRILDTFNGGADVFLWPETDHFFPLLKEALKDGRADKKRLEESVKRILAFKLLLGLIGEKPAPEKKVDLPALLQKNAAIAKRIGENSITLLRNRDKVLPLKLKKGARILLFIAPDKEAPFRYLTKFAQKLTDRGYIVTTAKTKDLYLLTPNLDVFDSVIFISDANPQYSEYRGFDPVLWSYMTLLHTKMKKPIMISCGTPYFLYDVASAPTYINAYHDCEVSVDALIRAIFGEIPFKGRSPVSVPECFSYGDGLHTPVKKR